MARASTSISVQAHARVGGSEEAGGDHLAAPVGTGPAQAQARPTPPVREAHLEGLRALGEGDLGLRPERRLPRPRGPATRPRSPAPRHDPPPRADRAPPRGRGGLRSTPVGDAGCRRPADRGRPRRWPPGRSVPPPCRCRTPRPPGLPGRGPAPPGPGRPPRGRAQGRARRQARGGATLAGQRGDEGEPQGPRGQREGPDVEDRVGVDGPPPRDREHHEGDRESSAPAGGEGDHAAQGSDSNPRARARRRAERGPTPPC